MPSPACGLGACVFQPAGLATTSRCSSSKITHGTMRHENIFRHGNEVRNFGVLKKLADARGSIHFIRVHLAHLRLRDFRNYARLDVDFAPGFHLLLGDNAQGKTNILEAVYLMATLRSFRGVGGAQMIRHGQKGYFVGGNVIGQGEHEIKMYWSARERNLSLDGQPVKKLTDYLGALRTVVFCTEDLQIVKGTARSLRRFMDLLLAQTQPGYLRLLQRYMHSVLARNALLKQRTTDEAALESFSRSEE